MKKLVIAALLLGASVAHADKDEDLLGRLDNAIVSAKMQYLRNLEDWCNQGFASDCLQLAQELQKWRAAAKEDIEARRQREINTQFETDVMCGRLIVQGVKKLPKECYAPSTRRKQDAIPVKSTKQSF